MLIAHLVPGYFALAISQRYWKPEWTGAQRIALWIAALGSTFVHDLDVIYNSLFRGFAGHTVLWTHSLFPHLGLVLVWWWIRRAGGRPYVQTMVGLVTIGGLSHLVLDVLSHGTPLLYPLSTYMFRPPPANVVSRGLWAYYSDPVLLSVELLMIGFASGHWACSHVRVVPRMKSAVGLGSVGRFALSVVAILLPLAT